MTPPCLRAALDYLARGWSPIPLHPPTSKVRNPGKQPMIRWEAYQRERPTVEDLNEWWHRWPRANVGVTMGTASGLVGLDIDGPAGLDAVMAWAGGAANIPATPAFLTPNSGRRLLYAIPPGVSLPIRRFDGEGKKEALRILAEGSQTVMPPSALDAGGYEWLDGCAPHEQPLAPAPDWLVRRALEAGDRQGVRPPPQPPPTPAAPSPERLAALERARLYLLRCDEAVSGQNGHGQTLKVADKIAVGFRLSDAEALQILWEDWNPRCRPPWTRDELARKISEARKTAIRPPGYLLDEPRRAQGVRGTSRPPAHGEVRGTSRPPAEGDAPPPAATPPAMPPIPAAAPARPRRLETFTAGELLAEELPPLRWVVPGVFPEGGTLLAGRPKGGKSWLVLQAALAIAEGLPVWGHLQCPPGESLYLALEDGRRRLQARLKVLCGQGLVPSRLHLQVDAPTLADGLVACLERWLDAHPACRLVAIDTLTRVRGRGERARGSAYEIDYDAVYPLTRLGQERHVAVAVTHHTRKPKDVEEDDPFDAISGTTGLSGAADMMLLLKRPIHSQEANLFCRGRDTEDQTLRLLWDAPSCLWRLHQGAGLPPEQQKAMDTLQRAGRPLSPLEAAEAMGKSHEATKQLLNRMKNAGLIRSTQGRYAAHVTASPEGASR